MIRIKKSPTADTRTCDFRTVSKETLHGKIATDPDARITILEIDLERCLNNEARAVAEVARLKHEAAELREGILAVDRIFADYEKLRKEKGWRR